MPAQAGIFGVQLEIPAFAGMTGWGAHLRVTLA
jgi:hypothetical protein